jgi:hypothetical protein
MIGGMGCRGFLRRIRPGVCVFSSCFFDEEANTKSDTLPETDYDLYDHEWDYDVEKQADTRAANTTSQAQKIAFAVAEEAASRPVKGRKLPRSNRCQK